MIDMRPALLLAERVLSGNTSIPGWRAPAGARRGVRHESDPVPGALLEITLGHLKDEFGEHWKKDYRIASTRRLMRDVIPEMRRWGLLRGPNADDAYEAAPLAARLTGHYPDANGSEDDAEGEAV